MKQTGDRGTAARALVLSLAITLQVVVVGRAVGTDTTTTIISVDSSAFVFSPGNWTGDAGRGGKRFRQTWNPGAYLRVTWETENPKPTATLLLNTSTYTFDFQPPQIAYAIDGVWQSRIPCAERIPIENLTGAGRHELIVILHWSIQQQRWGSPGKSGLNVLRVTGLQVDSDGQPVGQRPDRRWALIVGDSITEGSGASELAPIRICWARRSGLRDTNMASARVAGVAGSTRVTTLRETCRAITSFATPPTARGVNMTMRRADGTRSMATIIHCSTARDTSARMAKPVRSLL